MSYSKGDRVVHREVGLPGVVTYVQHTFRGEPLDSPILHVDVDGGGTWLEPEYEWEAE